MADRCRVPSDSHVHVSFVCRLVMNRLCACISRSCDASVCVLSCDSCALELQKVRRKTALCICVLSAWPSVSSAPSQNAVRLCRNLATRPSGTEHKDRLLGVFRVPRVLTWSRLKGGALCRSLTIWMKLCLVLTYQNFIVHLPKS